MIRQPHVVLAKRHGVLPATAQKWIYSGLIGRPAKPGEVTPEGRGQPPRYIVTAEDIANFDPPVMGRPKGTRTPRPIRRVESKHLKLQRLKRDSKIAIIKALRATGHTWSESARQVHVTIDAVMRWKRAGLL